MPDDKPVPWDIQMNRPRYSSEVSYVPVDCDVRKIMIDIVPGPDGMGHEVFATNIRDVENLLSGQAMRIDDLESEIHRLNQQILDIKNYYEDN